MSNTYKVLGVFPFSYFAPSPSRVIGKITDCMHLKFYTRDTGFRAAMSDKNMPREFRCKIDFIIIPRVDYSISMAEYQYLKKKRKPGAKEWKLKWKLVTASFGV